MAIGTDIAITHKFVSGKADGADPTLVQPSKWNQNENIGAGVDGQIAARDSTQVDGGSWVDPLLAGTSTIQVNSTTQIQLNIGAVPLRIGTTAWIRRRVTAAVTIGNGGLAASTVYFVYAFDNAGVTTLELSTTGHVTDAQGVEVKSGDATRTLVGMVRTNASTQFVDAGATRFAISWFNRKRKTSVTNLTANKTTTSAVFVELDTAQRAEFLTWGDTDVFISGSIPWSVNIAAARTVNIGLFIDLGVVAGDSRDLVQADAIFAGGRVSANPSIMTRLTEGYHHVDLFGSTTGDTLTVQGGSAGNTGVATWGATVQG